jgi:hypothetical protein
MSNEMESTRVESTVQRFCYAIVPGGWYAADTPSCRRCGKPSVQIQLFEKREAADKWLVSYAKKDKTDDCSAGMFCGASVEVQLVKLPIN